MFCITTGALHGMLAQESSGARELPIQLLVEVVAVCDHHDGRAHGLHLWMMSQEYHGETLSRPLCMPENTNLAITLYRLFRSLCSLLYGIILVIASKNLRVTTFANIKENIVLQQVEQYLRSKYRLEGHIIVSHLTSRLLPLHVAVFLGRHGANLGQSHIAHHIESIVGEKRRNELLIVAELQVSLAGIRLFTGWRFQLNHHQRQTIDKNHNVGALGVQFLHGILIHNQEIVALGMFKVYEVDDACLLSLQ